MLFAITNEEGKILGMRETDLDMLDYYVSENLVPLDHVVSDDTHYVANKTITPRPTMPILIGGACITGIPTGSVLTLGEQEYQVDDGEAEITGYAGTVKITCWPYLDAEVVI